MDGKILAQVAAVVFVAVAITATAIELSRKEERPATAPARQTQANSVNPLQAELLRCQGLGEGGPRDPACLRAWAESRRRFLMPGSASSQSGAEAAGRGEEAPSQSGLPNDE